MMKVKKGNRKMCKKIDVENENEEREKRKVKYNYVERENKWYWIREKDDVVKYGWLMKMRYEDEVMENKNEKLR